MREKDNNNNNNEHDEKRKEEKKVVAIGFLLCAHIWLFLSCGKNK